MDDSLLVQGVQCLRDSSDVSKGLHLGGSLSFAVGFPVLILILHRHIDVPLRIRHVKTVDEGAGGERVNRALRLNKDALVRNEPPPADRHQMRVLHARQLLHQSLSFAPLLFIESVDVDHCHHVELVHGPPVVCIIAIVRGSLLTENTNFTVTFFKVEVLNEVSIIFE